MSQCLSFSLINRNGIVRTRRNNLVSTNQHQHDLWGCLQRCSSVQVCRVLQNELCCTHQEWRRSWTCTVAGRGSRAIDCVIDRGASILRLITACHMYNSENINIHLPVSTSLTLVSHLPPSLPPSLPLAAPHLHPFPLLPCCSLYSDCLFLS